MRPMSGTVALAVLLIIPPPMVVWAQTVIGVADSFTGALGWNGSRSSTASGWPCAISMRLETGKGRAGAAREPGTGSSL